MHNPESLLENETHKVIWDFETQTDHQILVRRPDPLIINKKQVNLQDYGLCCHSGPQSRDEKMRK